MPAGHRARCLGCQSLILLDTHVLIWAINEEPRLGTAARQLINETSERSRILISSITPWEIALLVEKGRLALGKDVGRWIDDVLALPGIELVPLEPEISLESVRLPGVFHNDPADRMIVATARRRQCTLLTADSAILKYAADGYVNAIDASR